MTTPADSPLRPLMDLFRLPMTLTPVQLDGNPTQPGRCLLHLRVAVKPTSCGSGTTCEKLKGGPTRHVTFTHLPIGWTHVKVRISYKEYWCPTHETSFEALPILAHPTRMITDATARLVEWHLHRRIFVETERLTGVPAKTVRALFDDYVAEAERRLPPKLTANIGVDEIYLRVARLVLVSLPPKRLGEKSNAAGKAHLIDILPAKDMNAALTTLEGMPGRTIVRRIVTDFCPVIAGFLPRLIDLFPDAKVICDRFHFIMQFDKALERLRGSVAKKIGRKALEGAKTVMLKRYHRLTNTEWDRLVDWGEKDPRLWFAYHVREAAAQIHDARTPHQGAARLAQLRHTLLSQPALAKIFEKPITLMAEREPEILAFFGSRLTNGPTEAMNQRLRSLWRSLRVRKGDDDADSERRFATFRGLALLQMGAWTYDAICAARHASERAPDREILFGSEPEEW
ncbi:transposase [Azospirillum sp.]|uniref:transposase n=1 Tax=Azospirillum sp. TaxID=34012 RepID=UPI003D7429FA